jgi:actin-related protein
MYRAMLTLACPIENGVVTHWDEMELIWEHIFKDKLKTNPEDNNVFALDSDVLDKERIVNRRKMIQAWN